MTDATEPPRRAWVEQIMGMPISLHLRGETARDAGLEPTVEALYDELRDVDALFSTYRDDSQISRLNRGELDLAQADPTVRLVVALCEEARERTDGCFDAQLPSPHGGTWFDPSGLVKGWAVERASGRLAGLAGLDFCLNAGGDVVMGCGRPQAEPWRVGIEDPDRPQELIAVVRVLAGGVATSGSAHRGLHIVDPRTGTAAGQVRAVTVTGPSLMWADVYATAAVVRGADALAWLRDLAGYEGIVVQDGRVTATPALQGALLAG